MKNILLSILLFCGFVCDAFAASGTIQPKIMVIPYTKEGEDLRTILEKDPNKRIVITKIKEGFDSRGFTTVDLVAKLKAAKEANVWTSENQSDIKTQLLEMSGADIYVEAEILAEKAQSGSYVRIILTGFEISTGNSLSNKIGESGRFYTDDFGKLGQKAVDACVDDFLNVMQMKFTDIVQNGKSIVLDISIDQGSKFTFDSDVGKEQLPLSDNIELWLSDVAYKGVYHMQGATKLRIIYDDVKIPFRDESGHNYTLNKFGLEELKFFRTRGVSIGRDVKGSTMYITIK
jgi:hypothetical protein